MLILPASMRVYLARGATDMRKSIDGLAAVTEQLIGADPLSGHLFVFCNRRRDRIKILNWESSGYWLTYKRLEKGTFAWPLHEDDERTHIELTPGEFAALLGGIDLRHTRKRRWYSRPA